MHHSSVIKNETINASKEAAKFLSFAWEDTVTECMTFDYKKFSSQAHSILDEANALSVSILHDVSSYVLLSSVFSKAMKFGHKCSHDFINNVIKVKDDAGLNGVCFINSSFEDIIGVQSSLAVFYLDKIKSTTNGLGTTIDEFIKTECNGGNATDNLCNMIYDFSHNAKYVNYSKILTDFLSFAENLSKMVGECIYYKFGCTYAHRYDEVEKIHHHDLTCFDDMANNETDVHEQTVNVTHHEL